MGGLSTLHLVHGVMRAGSKMPSLDLAAAIAGGELTLVRAHELAALTTRLPEQLACGTPAIELFSDVERTRSAALEHHRVLSDVAASHDIAPVRLGALRVGEASIVEMLQADAAQLSDALDTVSGMVELALRIVATGGPGPVLAPAPGMQPATGRDYLRARSASASAGRDHDARVTSFVRDAKELLDAVAGETRASAGMTPPGQPRRWLDLAMLVNRDTVSSVETLVQGLVRRAEPLRLAITLSGPWPAYSFVAKEG